MTNLPTSSTIDAGVRLGIQQGDEEMRNTDVPSVDSLSDKIWFLVQDRGLGPGDRIGAERELSEQFGVTRWVIRRALEQLESQERIIRTNGRSGGIFVAHQKVPLDLSRVTALPQYLKTQGLQAGTTVIGTQILPADEELAEKFELPVGTLLIRIERLRLIDSVPLDLEWSCFPAAMFPDLLNHSLVGSLLQLLDEEYEIDRGEAVETIRSVAANRYEAAALQVPVGTPLLMVKRQARLTDGRVFEVTKELFRGESVEISITANPKKETLAQRKFS